MQTPGCPGRSDSGSFHGQSPGHKAHVGTTAAGQARAHQGCFRWACKLPLQPTHTFYPPPPLPQFAITTCMIYSYMSLRHNSELYHRNEHQVDKCIDDHIDLKRLIRPLVVLVKAITENPVQHNTNNVVIIRAEYYYTDYSLLVNGKIERLF